MSEPGKPVSEGLWQRPPAPPFDPDTSLIGYIENGQTSGDFEAQKRYMRRKLNWREALKWWAFGRSKP